MLCELFLTQRSLDRNARDESVGTALEWASEFEHYDLCRKILYDRYYCPTVRDKARVLQRACVFVQTNLLDMIFEVWQKWNDTDSDGNTVLHVISEENYFYAGERLLKAFGEQLNFSLMNNAGRTAYDCAVANRNGLLIALLKNRVNS